MSVFLKFFSFNFLLFFFNIKIISSNRLRVIFKIKKNLNKNLNFLYMYIVNHQQSH